MITAVQLRMRINTKLNGQQKRSEEVMKMSLFTGYSHTST